MSTPVIEVRDAAKRFGTIEALGRVSFDVRRGEVHCLLGDNGAGKSTLIKILAGAHEPTSGEIRFEGDVVRFASPRDALERGVATVYQDLALVPLMSITRNFFLGREPVRGRGPFARFDLRRCREIVHEELERFGLAVDDPDRPAGTLSGGERQSLAIARAVHFGAKVLILDEPTAALGVKQTALVLETIARLRGRGVGTVLVTHNVSHALAAGDRFTVLSHGRSRGTFGRDEVDGDSLRERMGPGG